MIHTVSQGDHLSSIAERYGFADPNTIWNHPQNAELRRRRRDLHVLYPGDHVFVPDHQVTAFQRPTNAHHKFVVNLKPLKLRAKLLNPFGKPLANATGTLIVDGAENFITTDGEGLIELIIPRTATSAEIRIEKVTYPLALGRLDPADTPSGVAGRLANLGYRYASASRAKEEREQLRFATMLFVDEHQVDVSSEQPEPFVDRLRKAHGT